MISLRHQCPTAGRNAPVGFTPNDAAKQCPHCQQIFPNPFPPAMPRRPLLLTNVIETFARIFTPRD